MSLTRIRDTAVEIIRNLPNRPTGTGHMTAAALKMAFDQAAENIKNAVNQMIGQLEDAGGAAEIGFQRSTAVPADDVQSAIENVQQQLAGASQGAVPNGSITAEKIADGAVTDEKLAEDAFEWVDLLGTSVVPSPTSGKDYDMNSLKFFYCKPLHLVRIEGYVRFEVTDTEAPYAFFDLPMRKKTNSDVYLTAQAHRYDKTLYEDSPLLEARAVIDTWTRMHVYFIGVSSSLVGHRVYARITGFYICREET